MANTDDITLEDLLVPAEDNAEASAPEATAAPFTPAAQTLARYALEAALDKRTRRRFTSAPALAVVVTVPTPAWVEPMYLAARTLASWDGVAIRTGTDRIHHQPAKGNEHVIDHLGRAVSGHRARSGPPSSVGPDGGSGSANHHSPSLTGRSAPGDPGRDRLRPASRSAGSGRGPGLF